MRRREFLQISAGSIAVTALRGIPQVPERPALRELAGAKNLLVGSAFSFAQMARLNAKKKFCSNDVIPAYEDYYKKVLAEA